MENDNMREQVDSISDLSALYKAVTNFDGCEIKKYAKNTVFGDGPSNAKLMLIGEAPGMNEDLYGIPFCGRSGELLENILKSIGLKRKEVYITNTIFWRPPNNRTPTTEEILLCRPFVEKHIALINPNLVLLVGKTAAEALLNTTESMHTLRQKYVNYDNCYLKKPIPIAIIFHPAYLLRQPLKKKDMWFDLLKIQKSFL